MKNIEQIIINGLDKLYDFSTELAKTEPCKVLSRLYKMLNNYTEPPAKTVPKYQTAIAMLCQNTTQKQGAGFQEILEKYSQGETK